MFASFVLKLHLVIIKFKNLYEENFILDLDMYSTGCKEHHRSGIKGRPYCTTGN